MRHRDFSGGDGDGVRRVRHANAPRFRRRKVDMLEDLESGGDHAKRWRQTADHLRGELLRERDKGGVLALAARDKLVRAHDVIVFVQVEIVIAAGALDDGGPQIT